MSGVYVEDQHIECTAGISLNLVYIRTHVYTTSQPLLIHLVLQLTKGVFRV